MLMLRAATVVSVSMVLSTMLIAGDWPGWRGPARDDVSTETGLLKSWPEDGPKKLWTSTDVGLGYAGIAVVDGVLYTLGADDESEFAMALSVETGEKLWSTKIGEFLRNGFGGGPRSTPTVAGDLVVCISGRGSIACLSRSDGAIQWSTSMGDLGGEKLPKWGFAESALVDGDRVICTPGGRDGTVACLSLATGEKLWQSADLASEPHYSSVIVAEHYGKPQYVQLTVDNVFGLDPATGNVLWQEKWYGQTAVIPTPIYHDGHVYVTSGYGVGCMLLRISPDNEVEKVYENKVMKNHHGGVIRIGEYLYGYSDKNGRICQNFMTGEQVWSDDGKDRIKGAVACADGMLYWLEENTGDCVLSEVTAEGWTEVSRFTLEPQTQQRSDRGKIWTHPVISNGRLYLRDQEIICCYDISAQ